MTAPNVASMGWTSKKRGMSFLRRETRLKTNILRVDVIEVIRVGIITALLPETTTAPTEGCSPRVRRVQIGAERFMGWSAR
jgi:hypothetical protein